MAARALRRPSALDEGTPKVTNCEVCDEPIIAVDFDDISRFAVPLEHARVLVRYGVVVYNIWQRAPGLPGWRCVQWWGHKPPTRGRLYTEHRCGVWK